MIGTIDISCNAKNPNFPLYPLRAFVNSPSSLRIREVPRRVGNWHITNVKIVVVYPDSTVKQSECVLVGGIWVGTVEGTSTSGTSQNGYTIFADGVDENNNPVNGYVLGKGDVEILEADGTISPDPSRYYVKLLSEEPTNPREGDMFPSANGYSIWQDGEAHSLGLSYSEMADYVDDHVPTKTSDLTNDSGFVTSSDLELKQDKLSDDQLSAVDLSVYEIQTKMSFTDNTTLFFVAPSYSLSKTILIQKGILAEDGTTWLKQPRSVEMGSNVSEIQTGLFQNATSLTRFTGKNITYIWGQVFSGCTSLTNIEIPSIINILGINIFNGCSALTKLTLPKTLTSVNRMAFNNTSLQQVIFEGKTLAQVKAMANYSRWGLTEDKIYTNAFENQLPTKTSDLTNDSGFITANDIITKRDLNDFNVYVDPMADITTTKFTVVVSYAGDPTYPLFTAELTHRGGEQTSWSWSPSGSNQSMMIDYSSVTDTYTLYYFNLQDGGGTEHSGSMTLPITAPYWTGETQDDWFHFSVTSQNTTITTKAYVDSLIAQLSARITALENN